MKESTRVLAALVAAIVGGALIAASGNTTLIGAADALAPIGSLWVSAIRMTVIPLVVSLLITGVASATDVGAIGRIGGRTLVVFVLLLAAIAAIVIPLAAALFALLPLPSTAVAKPTLPAGAAEAANQISASGQNPSFSAWLTSLIPSNPIAAAANGAMVPLILFTLILAIAIARSPASTRDPLVGLARALGNAMLLIVRWVVLLAPIGVFALVLPIAAHLGAAVAGAIGAYIAAYSVACVIVTLLLYPIVAIFGGIPIGRFARAALPSQLIAFSSSSSIASLPALIESGERLALPNRITGFVLPLAVSAFKVAAPVSWTIGALFVGWFYGIPLHARELATVAFAAVFLAFAAPGVPRGAFIMLTPLFLAIGLPAEGIGILIAVDALPDTFATTLNVTGDLAAAALVTSRDRRGERDPIAT
jgi:Na+/H+-dicarboxylate symporter